VMSLFGLNGGPARMRDLPGMIRVPATVAATRTARAFVAPGQPDRSLRFLYISSRNR
jgi:hypothetical protein